MLHRELTTISSTNDELRKKHSLQPKLPPKNVAGRPRSHSHTQKTRQIALPSTIPEGEDENDETQVAIDIEANNQLRTSFTKRPTSRTSSATRLKAKIIEVRAYENGGFEDKENGNGNGNENFHRDYVDRIKSSTHNSSVQSLQVQREQYCCFARWSPFERRLATSVGVLAGIIVVLVIVVGLLARGNAVA